MALVLDSALLPSSSKSSRKILMFSQFPHQFKIKIGTLRTLNPSLLWTLVTLQLLCSFFLLRVPLFYIFIFGCPGSSLLHGAFSSCGERGLLSSCSAPASHGGGVLCCGAQTSGCAGLSSYGSGICSTGSIVVTHGLSYSLGCMCDPPRSGNEPVSPVLAGRLLTTEPPGRLPKIF